MKPYTLRFTNRHGEKWEFLYDPSRGEGILRGSDVNWQEYRVIEGRAAGLILSDEEIKWLRRTWMDAGSETECHLVIPTGHGSRRW